MAKDAALKTIDKAIRAVERKIKFYSASHRNAMLEYAAGDMAEAYQIGAEEAQGEMLARLQTIRRSLLPLLGNSATQIIVDDPTKPGEKERG